MVDTQEKTGTSGSTWVLAFTPWCSHSTQTDPDGSDQHEEKVLPKKEKEATCLGIFL